MCNLNIWVKKKGVGSSITNSVVSATAVSYVDNSDGEGVYFAGVDKLVKGIDKINYLDYVNEIAEANQVITHQRLSTSGFEAKYSHPFADERWVLVHNGVFAITPTGGKSDTAVFFEEFVKQAKTKSVKEAIEESLAYVNGGSYSVYIYDKKEKIGYYFRSASSRIAIYQTTEGLFITTNRSNAIFSSVEVEYDVQPNHLYTVVVDNDKPTLYFGENLKEINKVSYVKKVNRKKDFQEITLPGWSDITDEESGEAKFDNDTFSTLSKIKSDWNGVG